jgi:glycerol-3-phosphate dehydrogenase
MARDASSQAAARVGEILQTELGLSESEVLEQVAAYRQSAEREKSILMGDTQC